MVGNRGQAYDALKLMQGAIVAVVLLGMIYGALQLVKSYEPGSDVLSISASLLSSAYAAAGTGQSFSRKAKLTPQFITGEAVKQKAGIDDPDLNVYFQCKYPVGTVPKGGGGEQPCTYCKGNSCQEITIKEGTEIDVCVYCEDIFDCYVVLGTNEC